MANPRVRDIVQHAASGDWNIPEFQREFEWKYEQVATLCESLCSDLPIGMLTLWDTSSYNEPQKMPVSGRRPVWIVDGQQRVTSLCIIAGKKPNWMDNNQWKGAFEKNRIFLNIDQQGEAVLGRLSRKAKASIPLDELINNTPAQVQRNVQEKCLAAGIAASDKASDIAVNALQILERVIPIAEVGDDKAVEDVADLYRRLNQQGTRLREAQIMLAYVSQHNAGWVREEFYPFLQDLSNTVAWELDPAHVLQVATVLAEGKARVGKASDEMWKSKIKQFWPPLKDAIEHTLLQLWENGITDQDMIPSSYTLIPLIAMHAKFGHTPTYNSDGVFKWFILANLSGRYGDAPLETLSKDGNYIFEASSVNDALQKLSLNWTRDQLQALLDQKFRDNSSQALLLHMLLWSTQAKDWIERLSIPTLTQATHKLEPHWHHIVPKVWGKRNGFEDCDKTANVTRLCAKTNVSRLKSKPPWEYVPEFQIPVDALTQHLVPAQYAAELAKGHSLTPDQFRGFLRDREELLVQQAAVMLGI